MSTLCVTLVKNSKQTSQGNINIFWWACELRGRQFGSFVDLINTEITDINALLIDLGNFFDVAIPHKHEVDDYYFRALGDWNEVELNLTRNLLLNKLKVDLAHITVIKGREAIFRE